jgi:hypothetical protein
MNARLYTSTPPHDFIETSLYHGIYDCLYIMTSRSQGPRGVKCGSAAARFLELRVRIPPAAWMSVSWELCVLSGRVVCDGLITLPEASYRKWRVCDRETSTMRRPWPTRGCRAMEKTMYVMKDGIELCLTARYLAVVTRAVESESEGIFRWSRSRWKCTDSDVSLKS